MSDKVQTVNPSNLPLIKINWSTLTKKILDFLYFDYEFFGFEYLVSLNNRLIKLWRLCVPLYISLCADKSPMRHFSEPFHQNFFPSYFTKLVHILWTKLSLAVSFPGKTYCNFIRSVIIGYPWLSFVIPWVGNNKGFPVWKTEDHHFTIKTYTNQKVEFFLSLSSFLFVLSNWCRSVLCIYISSAFLQFIDFVTNLNIAYFEAQLCSKRLTY